MKRLYVSTVGRGRELEEASRIYCVDADSGKVLQSTRLPVASIDLGNPRGGVRGARGCTIMNGRLYCAGYDGLYEFDLDTLELLQEYRSDAHQDIHQIYSAGNLILGCATRTNTIFGFFRDTGFFIHVDLTSVHPGLKPHDWDQGNRDTLHFNAMDLNNRMAFCAHLGGFVHWFDSHVPTILMCNDKYKGSHDCVVLPKTNEVVLNHSHARRTVTFDLDTWEEKRVLLQLPEEPMGEGAIALPGWMRGASYHQPSDTLFLGSSPASVYIIRGVTQLWDPPHKKIQISDEIVESVFDVIPHPDDWRQEI